MGSARVCLQWTLILFNTISVILGVFGILGTVYEIQNYTVGSAVHTDKVIQIASASVLILSGLIGCCAAASGSTKALWCFVIILVSLAISHGWKLWRYNEQQQISASEMLVTYNWIEELVKSGSMNRMQEHYKCCGKRGPHDYASLSLSIPKSCLSTENDGLTVAPYPDGCMVAVKRAYLVIYRFKKWAYWGLIGYECLGIWLSVSLICTLSTKTRRYEQ